VEIDRCPGCGAKVRPQSSWCTLCYKDLRPASQLVTPPPRGADAGDLLAAPLVEAPIEPGTGHWTDAGDGDIVDAELVGDDGRIYRPRDGSHDCDPAASPAVDVNAEPDEAGETSRLAALTWSCKCGGSVSFGQDACPACGASFLGDLHDGASGRHRTGAGALSWLPESRQVRLALAACVAGAFAIFVPLILSLFG
jgi:hypothetical protein